MTAVGIYSGSIGTNSGKLGMLNLHREMSGSIYKKLKKIEKRRQRTMVHVKIRNRHKCEERVWDGERAQLHLAHIYTFSF